MISIVTVNYKTGDYLDQMLESLFRYNREGFEVIVVNNDLEDDLGRLKEKFERVEFIQAEKNLGFAGGCNLGIEKAKGEFVLLVNPDVLFFENMTLYRLEEKMKKDSKVGVAGVSLKNLDMTQQESVRRFPTPLNQLLLLFKIQHIVPAVLNRWFMKGFDYEQDAEVDQVMGAFFCIRHEVIEQIGVLDDGYFMWYEEVDYCKRTVNAGWKVKYFADVSVKHKKGGSFERVETIEKQKMLRDSIRRYTKKHFGGLVSIVFVGLEPVFAAISFVVSLIKRK